MSLVKKIKKTTYCRIHALILFLISIISINSAAIEITDENVVKAAFLLNFSRYTEWTSEISHRPSNIFSICIWKDQEFTMTSKALEGKQIHCSPECRVVGIKEVNQIAEIKNCDTLFVSNQFQTELSTIKNATSDHKVLLVTDSAGEGAINFIVEQDKVRFDCNLEFAFSSGIRLSSQIIKLAKNIIGE